MKGSETLMRWIGAIAALVLSAGPAWAQATNRISDSPFNNPPAWTYWESDPDGKMAGSIPGAGGNPGAYGQLQFSGNGTASSSTGFWEIPVTLSSIPNPNATMNFNWQLTATDVGNPNAGTVGLFILISTTSGTLGTQVWNAPSFQGTWQTVSGLDVSSVVTSATTYYVQLVLQDSGRRNWTDVGKFDNVELMVEDAPNKALSSVTVTQASTADVADGTAGNEILKVAMAVTGLNANMRLAGVNVTAQNSDTSNDDVSLVRVFYNSADNFGGATDITTGGPYTFPAGAGATVLVDVVDQELPGNSTSYFWVVYNIATIPTSTENNTVDARIADGDITFVDSAGPWPTGGGGNPAGARTIKDEVATVYYVSSTAPSPPGTPNNAADPWATIQSAFNDMVTNEGGNLTGKGRFIIRIQDSANYNLTHTFSGLTTTTTDTLTLDTSAGVNPSISRAGAGRAMNIQISNFTVDNVDILSCANLFGIVIDSSVSNITIQDCRINGNETGLLTAGASNVTVRNCVIWGNDDYGIYFGNTTNDTNCSVINCTFYNNGVEDSANYFDVLFNNNSTGGTVKNCVFYPDSTGDTWVHAGIFVSAGSVTGFTSNYNRFNPVGGGRVGYYNGTWYAGLTDWQGGTPHDDQSTQGDPEFVNLAGSDFHIRSRYGHYTNAGSWARDTSATHPCIDAGEPDASSPYDWALEHEDNGDRIDLGAYGGTAEASHSGPLVVPSFGSNAELSSNYWTGAVNGNWNHHGNWAHGKPGDIGADPPTSSSNDAWGNAVYDPAESTVTLDPDPVTTNLTLDVADGYAYSLTMATGSGTLAVGGNSLNVGAGGFDGNGGTLTVGAGTVFCAGNWDDSDGAGGQGVAFTPATGTVNFNGTSGTANITQGTGNNFFNFTSSGAGGTRTALSVLDVNGAVSLSNGTFNPGSFTHTVAGNWTDSGGTFQPSVGTIQFNGTTALLMQAVSYFNHVSITGSLTASSAVLVRGNWTTSGTFTPGVNTLEFNGGANQTITLNTGFVGFAQNLECDKSAGTLGMAGTAGSGSIDGTLAVVSGTYDIDGGPAVTVVGTTTVSGGTLKVDSAATTSFEGNVNVNAGTFDASTGTVRFGTASASGRLTVAGGATLKAGSGGQVTFVARDTTTPSRLPVFVKGTVNIISLKLDYSKGLQLGTESTIAGLNNIEGANDSDSFAATVTGILEIAFSNSTNGILLRNLSNATSAASPITLRTADFDAAVAYNIKEHDSADYTVTPASWPWYFVVENATGAKGANSNPPNSGPTPSGEDWDTDPGDGVVQGGAGYVLWNYFNWKWLGNVSNVWQVAWSDDGNLLNDNWEWRGAGAAPEPYPCGTTPAADPNTDTVIAAKRTIWIPSATNDCVLTTAEVRYNVLDLSLTTGGYFSAPGSFTLGIFGTAFKSSGGTFVANAGNEVEFAGNLNQSIVLIGDTNGSFYNLDIDKTAGTATLGANVRVRNMTTVTAGSFDTGTYQLTANGALTVGSNTTMSVTAGGTVIRTLVDGAPSAPLTVNIDGTLAMSGDGSINWSTGTGVVSVAGTATMAGTSTLTMGAGVNAVAGSLTLTGGVAVYMPTGSTLNVTGTFNASGSTPTLTRASGGTTYALNFNSGATVDVSALNVSYYNANGMTVNSGVNVLNLNGVSFANATGAAGCRHLALGIAADLILSSCTFDSTYVVGTGYNVVALTGTQTRTYTFSQYGGAGAGDGPTNNYDLDSSEDAANRGTVAWARTLNWVGDGAYERQITVGADYAAGTKLYLNITDVTIAGEINTETGGVAARIRIVHKTAAGSFFELARDVTVLTATQVTVYIQIGSTAFSNSGGDKMFLYTESATNTPQTYDSMETFFSDDFETDTGWTYVAGWSRGVPGGGTYTPAADNTPAGTYSSGARMSDAGGDAGPGTSPSFDSSQYNNITLSLYVWFFDGGSDDHFLRVWNGASYTLLETFSDSNPDPQSTWFQQTYDVTAYKNAAMRIQVQTNDAGPATFNNFHIDDIQVTGRRAQGTLTLTLPRVAVAGKWSSPINWSPINIPLSSDDVVINDVTAANQPYLDVTDADGNANGRNDALSVSLGSSSASTLSLTDARHLQVGGAVTIGGSGTLTEPSLASTIYVGGNWTNNGTFSHGTISPDVATVVMNGTRNQTIGGSFGDFFHLTVANTGAGGNNKVTPSIPLDIDGNFTLSSGEFVPGSSTHSVAGSWSDAGGTFTPTAGTIKFDGATTPVTIATATGNKFFNLTVDKSAAANEVDCAGSFDVEVDGTLKIEDGVYDLNAITPQKIDAIDLSSGTLGGTLKFGTSAQGSTVNTSGNFSMAANGTLTMNDVADVLDIAGTFSVTGGTGTFSASGGSPDIRVAGNISVTGGTFNPTAGNLDFYADGTGTDGSPQLVTCTGTNRLGTFHVNCNGGASGSAYVVEASGVVNARSMEINEGIYDTGGFETDVNTLAGGGALQLFSGGRLRMNTGAGDVMDLEGNFTYSSATDINVTISQGTIYVKGNWTTTVAAVTFAPAGGTVEFDGTGAQTITVDSGDNFHHFRYNNSGAAATTLTGTVLINGNADIVDGILGIADATITVEGNATVAGPDAADPDAELQMNGTGTLKMGVGSSLTVGVGAPGTDVGTFTCNDGGGNRVTTITTSGTAGTDFWTFTIEDTGILDIDKVGWNNNDDFLALTSLGANGLTIEADATVDNGNLNDGNPGELKGIIFSKIQKVTLGGVKPTYLRFRRASGVLRNYYVKSCQFGDEDNSASTTEVVDTGDNGGDITVGSTDGYPSSGTLAIEGDDFAYTGKTATAFTGVSGVSSSHALNSDVVSATQPTTTVGLVGGEGTIPVTDTTGFPTSGTAYIEGDDFIYTGLTATSFTTVTGIGAHPSGADVVSAAQAAVPLPYNISTAAAATTANLIVKAGPWTTPITDVNKFLPDGYGAAFKGDTHENDKEAGVNNQGGSVAYSGTAYNAAGASIGVNRTVDLLLNGVFEGTDETNGAGAYSIPASLGGGASTINWGTETATGGNAGDVVTVYLNGETEKGITVTISNGTSISDLHIRENQVTVRNEVTAATTVSTAYAAGAATIEVAGVSGFPPSGMLTIGNDAIRYTGVDSLSIPQRFTGCTGVDVDQSSPGAAVLPATSSVNLNVADSAFDADIRYTVNDVTFALTLNDIAAGAGQILHLRGRFAPLETSGGNIAWSGGGSSLGEFRVTAGLLAADANDVTLAGHLTVVGVATTELVDAADNGFDVTVSSTEGFPDSGTAFIEGDDFTYTGRTTTALTGVAGVSSSHASGAAAFGSSQAYSQRAGTTTAGGAGNNVTMNGWATLYTVIFGSTGTFSIGGGATVTMGDNGVLDVNSGGLRLSGTSGLPVTITTPAPGTDRFAVDIAGGATFDARWYTIDSLNSDGLVFHAGTVIAGIDNGTFDNISPSGVAINLWPSATPPDETDRANIPVSFNNLTFNGAGGKSVRAGLSTPTVLVTGGGTRFGETYDDDRGEAAGSGGRIHWDAAPIKRMGDAATFASFELAIDDAGTTAGNLLRLKSLTRWPINANLNFSASGKAIKVEDAILWPRTGLAVDNAALLGELRNCAVVKGGVDFVTLYNCVVFDPNGAPVTTDCAATNTIFEEAVPGLSSDVTNIKGETGSSFQAAPMLDFHLKSGAAAAIDTGTNLSATFGDKLILDDAEDYTLTDGNTDDDVDLDGHRRNLDGDNSGAGAWDRGLDERYWDAGGSIGVTPDVESPALGDISQYWSVFRGTSRYLYVTTRSTGGAYDNKLILLNRSTLAVAATFQSPFPIHGMTYAAIDSTGADTEYRLFLLVDTDADSYADGILALIDTYTSMSGSAFTFTANFTNPAAAQTNGGAWYIADSIYVDRSFDVDGNKDDGGVTDAYVNRLPSDWVDGIWQEDTTSPYSHNDAYVGGQKLGNLIYRSIDGENTETPQPSLTQELRRWSKRIFVICEDPAVGSVMVKINADPLDYSDTGVTGDNRSYGKFCYSTGTAVGHPPYQWRAPATYLTGSSRIFMPVHGDGANWLAARMTWGGNTPPASASLTGWSIGAGDNENLYGHTIKLNGAAANMNTFIHVGSSESNRVTAFRADMASSGSYWTTAAAGGEALESPITSAPIRPLPVSSDYVFVGANDRIEKIRDDSAGAPSNGNRGWAGVDAPDIDGNLTDGYGRISSNLDYITVGGVTRLFWGTERGFLGSFQVNINGAPASGDEFFDAGFPYALTNDEVVNVLIGFEGASGWSIIYVTRNGRMMKFYMT